MSRVLVAVSPAGALAVVVAHQPVAISPGVALVRRPVVVLIAAPG